MAKTKLLVRLALVLVIAAIGMVVWGQNRGKGNTTEAERQTDANAQRMLSEGKQTFRFDTFGDEAFWSDALQLHRAIEGANFGGVGPGVSPKTALAVGLKVDTDALPENPKAQIKAGKGNLADPAPTPHGRE